MLLLHGQAAVGESNLVSPGHLNWLESLLADVGSPTHKVCEDVAYLP